MEHRFNNGWILRSDNGIGAPVWVLARLVTRETSKDESLVGQEYETGLRFFASLKPALAAYRETKLAETTHVDAIEAVLRESDAEIWAAVKSFERGQAA